MWKLSYNGTVRYTCDEMEVARFERTHGSQGIRRVS